MPQRCNVSPRLAAAGLLACAVLCAGPASAEMKEFRDWIAACDNTRTCNAYGFDADVFGNAYLRLERGGAADAPLNIIVAVSVEDGATFKLTFDDPKLTGLPTEALAGAASDGDDLRRLVVSEPQAVETLLASLRKAKKLVVTRIDAPGAAPSDPRTTEISLSGLAAALLWIDDQQKRVGTLTALIGRGDKAASTVPPPPALPAVTAAKVPAEPKAGKASTAVLAKARAACADKTIAEAEDATRLSANEVMYWFVCKEQSGAYNMLYALLIDSPGKPVRQVEFKLPREAVRQGQRGVETDMNPGFDESTQTLTLLNKGRGIGDCGQTSDWVWDGREFRMIAAKEMPTCKGVAPSDWPVLYRAQRK